MKAELKGFKTHRSKDCPFQSGSSAHGRQFHVLALREMFLSAPDQVIIYITPVPICKCSNSTCKGWCMVLHGWHQLHSQTEHIAAWVAHVELEVAENSSLARGF